MVKAIAVLRRDGVAATLRNALGRLRRAAPADLAFDAAHGTDTAGSIPLWKMAIPSPNARHGVHYQGSPEADLAAALAAIPDAPSGFHFIDLGCGKGRTLLIAARLGFAAVTGVEFAPELVAIARANAAKLGLAQVSVIEGDAASFEFPPEDLIVYLYNPFGAAVLARVMAALGEQRRVAPQTKVFIIYNLPLCAETVDASPYFARIGAVPGHAGILLWQARAAATC